MYTLVGGLLTLLLITATATVVARLTVAAIDRQLGATLRPAQSAAADLSGGYGDMETGERGFLLTHDARFLQPYQSGGEAVARARSRLASLLGDDPTTQRLLAAVIDQGGAWQRGSAEPDIAAARADMLAGSALTASAIAGKNRFDALRGRLSALRSRIDALSTSATQTASDTQALATLVTLLCAAAALGLSAVAVLLPRGSLMRPVNRLLAQVRGVAGGDLDRNVVVDGPAEIVAVGDAVEAMRLRIRAEIAAATAASDQVARLAEADRIARDVGSRVAEILFATNLAVQSAASRFPPARPALASVTGGLDHAVEQLRLAMYGDPAQDRRQPLGAVVAALIGELEPQLASPPEVRLDGDLSRELPDAVVADVVEVLRRALPTLTGDGPAEIALTMTATELTLRLSAVTSPAESRDTDATVLARSRLVDGIRTTRQDARSLVVEWRIME